DNLMNLYEPLNFNELIKTLNDMNYDLIIVPYEKETINYLYQSDFQNETKKIALIVGPEGGFTNDEIIQLQNFKNLKLISLTKTILRSETASLYALSIINNFLLCKGKK
ncbi:MAG: RNA methyltransferase, partial [Ureaplasma sp.]|nr:RNA methyltransferase [Ureaplasma sp.]